ncbi:hypothetical protein TAO_1151 [Candidatus Nitrosoglobus terrae]|uniref:Uncharacterized protein n=1 Tax=Candidatus Nitrosoglobus terrae TaxID=1630141 RepID=A0A1Q2SN32_9GAMM|nr:hypothetical protein TAO_1151 [Candidatus Nitrosoglobus terrae]
MTDKRAVFRLSIAEEADLISSLQFLDWHFTAKDKEGIIDIMPMDTMSMALINICFIKLYVLALGICMLRLHYSVLCWLIYLSK